MPHSDCTLHFYLWFPNSADDAVLGKTSNPAKKQKEKGRVELKQELTQINQRTTIGHKNWWCFHTLLEKENKTRKESGDKTSTEFNPHKKPEAGTQTTLKGTLHVRTTLSAVFGKR